MLTDMIFNADAYKCGLHTREEKRQEKCSSER